MLPVPLYGVAGTIDLHWSWWQTVTATTPPNLLTPDNISIPSMWAKWLGMSATSVMLATASSLALLGAAAGSTIAWLLFSGDSLSLGGSDGTLIATFTITPATLATGLAWACGVAFFGALFPAVRAARLPLATALRAA